MLPSENRVQIEQGYEKLADAAYKYLPEPVVDVCREFSRILLAAWLPTVDRDPKGDLGTLARAVPDDRLISEAEKTANTLFVVLSFIKEMSPQSAEDHSYLVEREWRIVKGMELAGHPSGFRSLTNKEKVALCAKRPIWKAARQSTDINIIARYGSTPVIDSFVYFNGLPSYGPVAQFMDKILVPDESEANWVRRFLSDHASYFGASPPSVITFPT
jgi:hypothetical protein